MRLEDLKMGDKFYPATKKEKATPIFGLVSHNSIRGYQLSTCVDLSNGKVVHKRKNLDVIKFKSDKQ